MKGVRTFIGIFPPPSVQAAIQNVQSSLKVHDPSVRWEKPNKFHSTLKFLGNLSAAQNELVRTRLLTGFQRVEQFKVFFIRVGCFPSLESARIIWIGSDRVENARLSDCSALVEDLCHSTGCEKEERVFHPHVTLGRVKGKISSPLIKKVENITFEPIQFLCTELLVMKSDLSPSGSAYSQLYTIPLKQ
jgi:RNA 2',3'-cyclic 3'-phosphodiesterase